MIAEGTTMGATTYSHKEHATAIAPFYSSFFETLHKEQWKEVRLGEAPLQIIDGDRGKNYPKQKELFDNGYCLFLNTKNVLNAKFDFTECQFINKEKDESLRKGKMQINDIVLTTRGTIGNMALYRENINYKNIRINSGMVILRPDTMEVNSTFLLYAMLNSKKYIDNFVSGSAQPQLPIKDLSNLTISLPPLETQRKVAEILSSFDDKIDLLHRQNKTLESLALTLFRHTFIDNPKNPNAPCHAGQACNCHSEPALAGEESIDIKSHRDISASPQYDKEKFLVVEKNTPPNNEQHNRGATSVAHNEPWEMGRLGDYITPKKGKNITQKNAIKGIYPVIAGGLEPAYYHNQSNTESPVITISASGANAGFVNIHYCSVWSSDSSYIDKTITPYVYFFYLFLKMNQNILYDKQEGSAQPHIYPSHIMELEIPHYPKNLIETFESQIQIYFDKISHNMGEILNLQSMCDILLSKILNDKMEG